MATYVYTILEIIGLFTLQKALFSLWTLILTLQFLTYIAAWQIRYPPMMRMILYKLRVITLGEFLDDLQIGDRISKVIGIPSDDS